ncbi:GNAT family N-acetyltransferase [Carnobacterium iners]|uniref:GNAT family N-acetyltransferase n=1 Tax=Carnobacterium iners TaxID=1073423 RepID=UPI0008B61590|nr:GNAT family N-acetyltransferase [Carnobacterium iners]SEL13427.1 Acetyltransferase (GNAT) domain-containing protein [Carnobacterium iners]
MSLEDFDKHTTEGFNIVEEDNDKILGFTSLDSPDNFIHNLFVLPDVSGKDIGRQLVHASIQRMTKHQN